jgi:integrase
MTVETCADAFIRSRLLLGKRSATVEWYTDRLSRFTRDFGPRMVDSVTRAEFREWLTGSIATPASRISMTRAVRALWRWAIAEEPPAAAVDITSGLRTSSGRKKTVEFLTVDECRAVLDGAGSYRAAVALMLFAGIRPHEISGKGKPKLLWQHVDPVSRSIRIPGDIAKVDGATRVLEGLPDALWRWIGLSLGPKEPICHARVQEAVQRAGKLAGFGPRRRWPTDALRHTFATYLVAETGNPGQAALWLGHRGDTTMLYNHYMGLTTKAEASRFWAL